ncbi:hypothetical protein [Lewinella cohaerens]|uniref:hypothetical protein n=1 Tax=Lewinella cohaerens TaxID=70995 RepID=UPI00036BE770|nr:hypothetical protein [Lewinella cohaerens]
MFRTNSLIIILLLSVASLVTGQSISGQWQGIVWQTNSSDTFSYDLRLQQQGQAVSGQATSSSKDGKTSATFIISGRWSEGQLQLQEVEQLSPKSPLWCLKFITARLSKDQRVIDGDWKATGCQPGFMRMTKVGGSHEKELPFSYPGRWTGYLSQSDRDYGFYYELNLTENGRGSSHIVSEGAGGEATHLLKWEETEEGIQFWEDGIAERTDPDWKWCMKNGQLLQNREDGTYQLSGDWSGYLEHKTLATGACAPGTVFLTKPVLTQVVQEYVDSHADAYHETSGRTVKVDRVLQVRSDKIRIKVWDNGIVDGDILTLFLNGQQILHEYRVNKRKWSIPVDVLQGENLLILHADDLGDIPPNTVAVSIDDGVKEQVIVLSSNLRESGAILIQPFKVD